jgi:hypothetical protein
VISRERESRDTTSLLFTSILYTRAYASTLACPVNPFPPSPAARYVQVA